MRTIIADTSCLILYDKIGHLELLHRIFPELIVTFEVAEEFGYLPDWISVVSLSNHALYFQLLKELEKGEASSIALASENQDSLLIIDEKKGRKKALELDLEIIGSLGIMIKAKEAGIIRTVTEILELINQTDFRVSDTVKKVILRNCGEDH